MFDALNGGFSFLISQYWVGSQFGCVTSWRGHDGCAPLTAVTTSRSPRTCSSATIAAASNWIWLADITYVETDQGWLYLATVMDLYSRKIVGWAMADHLRGELPLASWRWPLRHSGPTPA
jgi:transposase InsO family protein